MNEYLSQISDNYGIVSDENGEIKVVTKSETNCELQDILLKENELENLNQELITAKEELTENKANTIFGELGNIVIIGGGIFLGIELFPATSTQLLIYMLMGFYVISKSILLAMCGTRMGRYKKNKKLKSSIEFLEENSVQLEVELKNLKEKAKYKVESDTKDYCAQYGLPKNTSEVLNADLGKVQVLKLTRKHPKK